MYIAKTKRSENIAEYILYLWQLEDLLRALQFSPEAVWSQLVAPQEGDPERQQNLFLWYIELSNLLRSEGKESHGHLDHTLHLIRDLQDLHDRLMTLPAGETYRRLFIRLAPDLPRLREALAKPDAGDIELCFRALYAVMLYRIKDGQNPEKHSTVIREVIETISPLIGHLASLYRQTECGEIDLFK